MSTEPMTQPPSIIGCTFARGGSKGLPGKNIKPFNGKPLIAHAIEAAKQTPSINRVIVSTDSTQIADVARQYGADVPFMRPDELASDTASEWHAWQHAIRTLREQGQAVDILVAVPTTAPLRLAQDVEKCIQKLLAHDDADMVITVVESGVNPAFNLVKMDDSGQVDVVNPPPKNVFRRQDAPPVYEIIPAAYAARAEYVLNSERLLAGRVKAVSIPRERAVDVDDIIDFEFAEFLHKRYNTP